MRRVLLLLSGLCACAEPPAPQDPVVILFEPDMPASMKDAAPDAIVTVDTPPDMPIGPPPAVDVCDALGLERAPVPTAPESPTAAMGDVAAPFVVETDRGPWSLEERWTGCDTYVFLNYQPRSGPQMWASDVSAVLERSARNVHYFFSTYEEGLASFNTTSAMRAKIDAALARLPQTDADHWGPRLHVLTRSTQSLDAGAGAYARGLSFSAEVFGIDRFGRYDPGGSLARVTAQGFSSELGMAAYLPHYYNFAHAQARELEAQEDVTVVSLFDATSITKEQNNQVHQATFPDAEAMARFDTMELDIAATCGPTPTDCGEWDYEAFLQWCSDAECTESREIALWITPYARPGTRRWVVDATPFLPLLAQGGTQHIRFGMLWNMNPNQMNVSFRLRETGGPRPVSITPAFRGGNFDASYNEREPVTFTPSAGATRVELVALLSGHGQEAGSNCAEWCDHGHVFEVNGSTTVERRHTGQAGQALGCAERTDEGVVPGQYGNWAPSRAAWCPGLEVEPWREDITAAVTPGQENTLTYRGTFAGGEPRGGRIRLSSYIVVYE